MVSSRNTYSATSYVAGENIGKLGELTAIIPTLLNICLGDTVGLFADIALQYGVYYTRI